MVQCYVIPVAGAGGPAGGLDVEQQRGRASLPRVLADAAERRVQSAEGAPAGPLLHLPVALPRRPQRRQRKGQRQSNLVEGPSHGPRGRQRSK